jgi:serine/threonine protein kinase
MAGKYTAPDYMSDSMKDIVAGMLTLDPSQRLTVPQLYTHRWVTGSLACRSLTLPRALLTLNETTNSYEYDTDILDHMEQLGVDRDCIIDDLVAGECNQITATYFLFAEAIREGKGLPPITKTSRQLGSSLVCRSRAAQSVHGFSLDVEDVGDRNDEAHFAPSRSRRQPTETRAS